MKNQNLNNSLPNEQVDLWELCLAIWSNRLLISVLAVIFAVFGLTYSLLAREQFKAVVVLAPSEDGGGTGGSLAQYAGLVNLVGVNIPSGIGRESLAVLESRDFVRSFIEERDLVSLLLESFGSDDDAGDIRDAVDFFVSEVFSVKQDPKSGLVVVSIRWSDPEVAAEWANQLVIKLNERLREKSLTRSEQNVAYLQREIASVGVTSVQQSLGRVMESEIQKLLIAKGNEEFAFKVIDRAVASKRPEWPKTSLIVVLSFVSGLVIGVIVAIIRKTIPGRAGRETL